MRRFRKYFDLIYPRVCTLCSSIIVDPDRESVCGDCESALVPTTHACKKCSAPVIPKQHYDGSFELPDDCRFCTKRDWAFGRAYCFTAYSGLAMRATRKIKERQYEPLTLFIGSLLSRWLLDHPQFECSAYQFIVPISQHWYRRITARYNQSEVLSDAVARDLKLPTKPHWLVRSRWTKKQGTQSIAERLENVVGSFTCRTAKAIRGANILLVDDVMTSGATLDDASRALLRQGAASVDVATFARGVGAFDKKKLRVKDEAASMEAT